MSPKDSSLLFNLGTVSMYRSRKHGKLPLMPSLSTDSALPVRKKYITLCWYLQQWEWMYWWFEKLSKGNVQKIIPFRWQFPVQTRFTIPEHWHTRAFCYTAIIRTWKNLSNMENSHRWTKSIKIWYCTVQALCTTGTSETCFKCATPPSYVP